MGGLYLICWRRNYPQDRGTRPGDGLVENISVHQSRCHDNGIMNIESRGDPHRHLFIERIEHTI